MALAPGLFRLLLALVVILHHSTPLRLGRWAVGLFFCLSGFWIAEMWGRKYRKLERPYLEFLVSRWGRLAPGLFVTTAMAAIVMYLNLVPGDLGAMRHWSWWVSQPLIAGSARFGRLLPPAWSLDVEMQFYIVAPLLVVAMLKFPKAIGIAVAAIAVCWCWLANARGMGGESPRLDVWIGIFLLGILASTIHWRPGKRMVIASICITLLVFITAASIPMTRHWILLKGSTGHALVGSSAAFLTVATVVTAVPLALATTAVPSNRFDRFLGDLSYPLYLFHWLPRNWYYAQLPLHPGPVHALMLLSVNVVVAFLGAIILLLAVDRPLQRLRARWVAFHRAKNGAVPIESAQPAARPSQAFAGTV